MLYICDGLYLSLNPTTRRCRVGQRQQIEHSAIGLKRGPSDTLYSRRLNLAHILAEMRAQVLYHGRDSAAAAVREQQFVCANLYYTVL